MWVELVLISAALANVIANECEDDRAHRDHCAPWKNNKYCEDGNRFQPYMKKHCKKTCGFCAAAPCNDNPGHRASCSEWKKYRYCLSSSQYHSFMKTNCKKTCGFCSTQPPPVTKAPTTKPPPEKSGCEDNKVHSRNCNLWKTRGFCESDNKYFGFMSKNCKSTCGLCKAADCGLVGGRVGRVIGGVDAAPNYWKWQVALTDTNTFFCGGSLIHPQWVLTAAHCTAYRLSVIEDLKVVLGEHDRRKREGKEVEIGVEKIINHANYRSGTLENDIALIKLKKPAPMNDEIGLVCLPKAGEQVKVAKKCYISGWGKMKHPGTSAPVLQQAAMPIVDQSTCQRQNSPGPTITKQMVCAGYGPSSVISGCHGDSGGPLVCENDSYRYVLEGAVSWGSTTCDSKDKYTVFARISEYIDWIEQNMK